MNKRFSIPKLNSIMQEHDCLITGVPGGAIYTIGLIDKWKHPELAIHGLTLNQADGVLRSAIDLIKNHRHSFAIPGSRHERVVKGFLVESLPVSPANFHDWFGQALGYHGLDCQIIQLLWPDPDGNFPGDRLYGKKYNVQKRFDVRRPEYVDLADEHDHGCECAVCGEAI